MNPRHFFRHLLIAGLWLTSSCLWAQTQLDVRLQPRDRLLRANIEAHVGPIADRDHEALSRARRSVERQAQEALRALGYYQAQMRTEVTDPDSKPRLLLHVEQGQPVRLREVDIRLSGDATQLQVFRVPSGVALQAGQPLDHGVYESARQLLQRQAEQYGFFDGRFTRRELLIDPDAGWADIHLHFDSGARYRLGKVSFTGEHSIDESLLRRMVPFTEQTPYDADLLANLASNLRRSGFFADVRVDALPETAQGRVIPVQVRLDNVKPHTISTGIGYDTDVGVRTRASWTRHWLNPQGHSLGVEGEASVIRQSLGTWYQIPLENPLTDNLRLLAGYQREDFADVTSTRYDLGAAWSKRLANDWQRTLSLNWQEESFDVGRGSANGRSTLLLPGVAFDRLRSDSLVDPSNGYRLQIDLRGAREGLLSDMDIAWLSTQARGLHSFDNGQRLLGRVQLGAVSSNSYTDIPPTLRFFAGGDQSVRGYDFQSLSPEDEQGNKVGARYLLAGSLEYQYPLVERWRLATFVDQGNAFNHWGDQMVTGVGMGVRWVSPVGPLRLDLAHALDDPRGVRLHFSMGPEL
ncbi:MAG TPA: autotransporter assembly complex family protein [Pseudomonas sp.]|nr:autotransporter assembly complex family protein [Pseudomonas sp.]